MSRQNKRLLIGAGAILVVVLIVIVINRGGSRREALKAFENLASAETLHAKSELTIHLPSRQGGRDRPFTDIDIVVDGDVRWEEGKNPEMTGQLALEAKGRGNIFFADGEARILQDRVLFNLENLPVFLNPSGSLVKRWTEVAVPLLETRNGDQVREALASVVQKLESAGKETIDGESLRIYTAQLAEEEEQALGEILRQRNSGNRALHIVYRLLDANIMKELAVGVDPGSNEIRRIQARFVRPLADGREFDFATLTLTFSDYGKEVVIDAPRPELAVDAEIFADLFGAEPTADIQISE